MGYEKEKIFSWQGILGKGWVCLPKWLETAASVFFDKGGVDGYHAAGRNIFPEPI